MKKTITESQLRHIIKESIKKVLNELSPELTGAAAIKASRMANDDRLSPYERARKQRQADSLYSGAKDRFRDEHGREQYDDPSIQNLYVGGDMPSIFGKSSDQDRLSTSYTAKGLAHTKRTRYGSDGATKTNYEVSDGGYSADLDPEGFYRPMTNQNLRRADRAEKDFSNLRKKAQAYNKQLDDTEKYPSLNM